MQLNPNDKFTWIYTQYPKGNDAILAINYNIVAHNFFIVIIMIIFGLGRFVLTTSCGLQCSSAQLPLAPYFRSGATWEF